MIEKLQVLEKSSEGAPIVSFIEDGAIGDLKELCLSVSESEIDPKEADDHDSDDWEIL